MTISEQLKELNKQKTFSKKLYDECGFEDTQTLSTYASNLSGIVLSVDLYDRFIDENFTGNVVRYKGVKYRERIESLPKTTIMSIDFCLGDLSDITGELKVSDQFTSTLSGDTSSSSVLSPFAVANFTTIVANNIIKVESGAFLNCSSIVDAYMPKVESFGSRSFQKTNLSSISQMPNVNYVGGAAFGHTKIPNVILSCCKHVDDYAFSYCPHLSSICVPNLLRFNAYIFAGSTNMKILDFSGRNSALTSTPSINENTFIKTYPSTQFSNLSVYVPDDMVESWKTADIWKDRIEDGTIVMLSSSQKA